MSRKILHIRHQVEPDGIAIVEVDGSLQLGEESSHVVQKVEELLRQGYRRFVVDVSRVSKIDSTGLGRFIAVLHLVQQAGGRLILANPSSPVQKTFRVTRLDQIFEFQPSVAAALEVLRQQ